MNTPEIKAFIKEHSPLFWYIPEDKKEEVSPELLVETILNYGDKEAVLTLFNLMGIKNVARVFYSSTNQSERKRANYHELTINYFNLLFSKYA
jgi:hypothetical protein